MRRVLISKVEDDIAYLEESEVHHLTRVIRKKSGDVFEGLTEDGRRLQCVLFQEEGRWKGRVTAIATQSWESSLPLKLGLSLTKRDAFESVLQQSTELGVQEIYPLKTKRSEIHLSEKRVEKKLSRWNRLIEQSLKQCGRTEAPRLHPPIELARLLEARVGLPLFFDEAGTTPLDEKVLRHSPQKALLLLIGPEGGWDEAERELALSSGAHAIRLGPRILKAETAAVVGVALMQYLVGDLQDEPDRFQIDYRAPSA